LVERKDRSYEAGHKDTPETRIRWIFGKVDDRIPNQPGVCRVLIVGFQHLVPNAETPETDQYYQRALEKEFEGASKADLPHLVVIEHLGLEPERGGERNNFFSPQFLNWNAAPNPAMDRVARLLVRTLGVELAT